MTIRALVVRSSVILILASCGKGEKTVASSPSPAPPVAIVAPRAPADTCVKNGLWAPCSIQRRLKQSGFVVKQMDTASHKRDGFSVEPVVFSLGKSRLEAFIYESEAAATKAVSSLDTVAVAPKGKTAAWPLTPLFIRNTNLIAVLLTENARQAERATLALTAGPPQKGAAR